MSCYELGVEEEKNPGSSGVKAGTQPPLGGRGSARAVLWLGKEAFYALEATAEVGSLSTRFMV